MSGKISRRTLFDYVQIWRKSVANYSQKSAQNFELCSKKYAFDKNVNDGQIMSHITSESSSGNYGNCVYKRNSPSSIIVEQNTSRQKNGQLEKRFEYNFAAQKQSKCNRILRDYFTSQRLRQTAEEEYTTQKLSKMVVKLQDIMSLNVAVADPKVNQKKRLKAKHYSVINRQCMDFKPQSNSNMNRWHIKLPQRFEINEVKQSSLSRRKEGASVGRLGKSKKLVELPSISGEARKASTGSIPSSEEKEIMEKCKPPENWQFGSLSVPRLEI